MSLFLNNLKDKLKAMDRQTQALLGELDSSVACLDRGKLESLFLRLDQDFNKLLDKLWAPEKINALRFPFIFMPDGLNGPLYRQITEDDLSRGREAHKSDIWVVIGGGKVGVMVASEVASECNVTVSQVILVLKQHGYVMLDWDQYRKLLDEIDGLIGGGGERYRISHPSRPIVIGVPLATTRSHKG